ncbi:hypothetical protein [Ruegeria sp. HKCCD6109]|uniref:hypothetical protein n=1 Tax=Ruegeria sp. HKCCD6109 TaxID=2683017 RepID=UPI00149286D7|nr:hypothetical protein [Ruegeria sp. HKCCD6109]NOD65792.1 hypothetical protein [Ruegeria sp. HKCCD6109]
MNPEIAVWKIKTITSLPELDGYEAHAKARGLLPEELMALHQKRKELTPKKRRKR